MCGSVERCECDGVPDVCDESTSLFVIPVGSVGVKCVMPGVLCWGESFVSWMVIMSMLWLFANCSISVVLFLSPLMLICSILSVFVFRWFVECWVCLVVNV